MTVPSQTARDQQLGDGTTVAFTVPFRILDETHVRVLVGSTEMSLTTDYAVALGATNHVVTFVAPPTALAVVTFLRSVPATQETDYVPNDPFPAESHERALDKLTMLVQQLAESIVRSLILPPETSSGVSTQLPVPEALNIIGWDAAATALRNFTRADLATAIAYADKRFETFDGDAVTTVFNLATDPGSLGNLEISVDGLVLVPGVDFTFSGTTLTFTAAPAAGVDNVLVRYDEALPTGVTNATAVLYSHPAGNTTRTIQKKADDELSIFDFGATGDGVADDAPAFRAAYAYAKANGGCVVKAPKADYRFITASPIASVSSGCCVPMDGVSDFHIVGERGARILMEADTGRVNAFTHYVSATSEAAGDWSQRNSITGFTFIYTRAGGFVGNMTGILALGCEDSDFSYNTFDYSAALGGCFGTNGSGRNMRFVGNVFKGVATCFDMAHCENCTFDNNRCIGQSNAVTAFGHFYDVNTVADVRMETPLTQVLGSGNRFSNNIVTGYPGAFALRGIRDSWVLNNRIHSFSANDATTRNMISIYTEADEFALVPSQHVSGMVVDGNLIYNVSNAGAGTTRAIFINQFAGVRPVTDVTISNNIIHDMSGEIGISFDGNASGWQVFGNIVNVGGGGTNYGRSCLQLLPATTAGLSPTITPVDDEDIILEPGATSHVRFGVRTVHGDVAVNGSFEMKMKDGTVVKVPTVP